MGKNVSKAVADMLLKRISKQNQCTQTQEHRGARSGKEKSRGVEMLQNTAVKIGQDLESRTAERRGNTRSISGKTATGTKAFPLSGAPRAGGTHSHGAEGNLELFRITDRLNPPKRNWKV